jgi:hypothetical protein
MTLKPGTYRMGEEAISVCERYGLPPRELIPWLAGEMENAKRRAEAAEALKDAVRGIVKVEGVKLDEQTLTGLMGVLNEMLKELRGMKGGKPE